MWRVAAALVVCCLALDLTAGSGPRLVAGAPSALAQDAQKDTAGDSADDTGPGPASTPEKAPARQVPVEPIDEPEPVPAKPVAADKAADAPADSGGKDTQKPAGQEGKTPLRKASAPAADKPEPAQEKSGADKTVPDGAEAKTKKETVYPGLPIRKPRKPVYRKKEKREDRSKRTGQSLGAHDKKLCKALQSCRNAFIRCKDKIKHPDQSKEWSAAKEECGATYKSCVHKDFRGGEWFFTRWFYFQELKCE